MPPFNFGRSSFASRTFEPRSPKATGLKRNHAVHYPLNPRSHPAVRTHRVAKVTSPISPKQGPFRKFSHVAEPSYHGDVRAYSYINDRGSGPYAHTRIMKERAQEGRTMYSQGEINQLINARSGRAPTLPKFHFEGGDGKPPRRASHFARKLRKAADMIEYDGQIDEEDEMEVEEPMYRVGGKSYGGWRDGQGRLFGEGDTRMPGELIDEDDGRFDIRGQFFGGGKIRDYEW